MPSLASAVLHFALLALIASSASAAAFSFVAIGDIPYHVPRQLADFERLTARINTLAPAFTVHVGDIKSGASPCHDSLYVRTLELFARFERPLIYTPGDNEWTDCHRARDGKYDPLERLGKLRSTFYSRPGSLGRTRLPLEHQSAHPDFRKYVENARWWKEGVLFATLHVVGSNNNLQRDAAAVNEYVERNTANLAWLASTFDLAKKDGARAVVVAFQADPQFHLERAEDRRSGYTDTVRAIKRHVAEFGKPVLLVHGDTHRFVVDKPVRAGDRLLYNATRLIVFGDSEVSGVLVSVDPEDPDVFSFKTITAAP